MLASPRVAVETLERRTLLNGNMFITNISGNAIGEYTTDGTTVNGSLVPVSYGTDGVAVEGPNLFVTGNGILNIYA